MWINHLHSTDCLFVGETYLVDVVFLCSFIPHSMSWALLAWYLACLWWHGWELYTVPPLSDRYGSKWHHNLKILVHISWIEDNQYVAAQYCLTHNLLPTFNVNKSPWCTSVFSVLFEEHSTSETFMCFALFTHLLRTNWIRTSWLNHILSWFDEIVL